MEAFFGEDGGSSFHGWFGDTVSVPITLPNWRLLTPAAPVYLQAAIPRSGMNTLWGHVASDRTFTTYILHRGAGTAPAAVYGVVDAVDAILDAQTGLYMVSYENIHMRGDLWSIGVVLLGAVAMTQLTYYLELKP